MFKRKMWELRENAEALIVRETEKIEEIEEIPNGNPIQQNASQPFINNGEHSEDSDINNSSGEGSYNNLLPIDWQEPASDEDTLKKRIESALRSLAFEKDWKKLWDRNEQGEPYEMLNVGFEMALGFLEDSLGVMNVIREEQK
jgi:hypothetical protein